MGYGEQRGIWIWGAGDAGYGGASGAGANRKVRILIVDDHPQYRRGLCALFEIEPDMEAVGEAGPGLEALAQIDRIRPDIVLMDVNMAGMDGMEANSPTLIPI